MFDNQTFLGYVVYSTVACYDVYHGTLYAKLDWTFINSDGVKNGFLK